MTCEACHAPARHRIHVHGATADRSDEDHNMINLCNKCRARIDEDRGCQVKMFDIIVRRIDNEESKITEQP